MEKVIKEFKREFMPGFFCVFEGGEGSGKTTVASEVVYIIQEIFGKDKICYTREPGNSSIGTTIREMLLTDRFELNKYTELMLYMADRFQHLYEVVRPQLTEKFIICDRYYGSTVAYQGYARGLNFDIIDSLLKLAKDEFRECFEPDVVFYLDVDAEIGLTRSRKVLKEQDSNEDKFENLDLSFHINVRDGYKRQCSNAPNWEFINANNSIEAVIQEVLDKFFVYYEQFLTKKGRYK